MSGYKRRVLLYLSILLIIGAFLAFSNMGTWKQIAANKKAKAELSNKYADLLKSEENLEGQVIKLQNTEYVLKYAREKYFFSKPGELIIDLNTASDK